MERSRRSRLPWGIVLLIVALSCAIAYVAALIYARTADSASFTKVRSLQIDSASRVEAVSDGLVVYDGSTIRKVSAQSLDGWSYAMGVGADFSASDAGVAAWNDRTLTLIDGSTGVTSYSGSMDETVLSARMGRMYTAALLGPEHNSTIVLMESGGRRVDSITLADQTVVDYGFFYNDKLFWVMTLDTNGTVPCCTVSTYRPGRRIVGQITDSEQTLYRALFRQSQIYCVGDTFVKVFDYNGKEKSDLRRLVYGWMLADADETMNDDPLMAYVPTGQYDASGEMRDVRMVRGSTSRTVRMPYACASIVAKEDGVYGFSGDGYVMVAKLDRQKVDAYRLNASFDQVYGVADGSIAMLSSGNTFYFVSLG